VNGYARYSREEARTNPGMEYLTSRERLRRCCRHLELDRPGLFLRGVTEGSPPHPSYEPLRRLGATYGDRSPRCLGMAFDCRELHARRNGASLQTSPQTSNGKRHGWRRLVV